ncbi:T9SS type A sorting domain-containing protein [Chitinophaga horti]|uniref:T9SS type A sorting domain-containing protein n=1 Tax=Chitinophaga horti TaxID=2920382 RepID=A0ABY6IWC3_9BACT|nr:T9SS type A sorting domain-containing protein [Chitinophaga horti]UYQ91673.1 T9SS type A sorting domain-containing protein [Chitinophaga horti]
MKYILSILTSCLLCSAAFGQDTVFVPSVSQIGVLTGDPVSIYSNVVNEGTIRTNANAIVNFYGKYWNNVAGSFLLDESADGFSGKGGIFRFLGNNPRYTNIGMQSVFGGYNVAGKSGVMFPNLEIDNTLGVSIADLSDIKVRNNLHFVNGHLFLNGWNLVVGDRQPGTITGFNDKAFVVTGPDIAGGFLYREQVNAAAGDIIFPVGTSISSYAPASLKFNGTVEDFRVRVFDSVYQYATNGPSNRKDFTNKTWHIGHGAQLVSTDLTLQHMDAEEGSEYASYRSNSYVSHFSNNAWDYMDNPEYLPVAGALTSGAALRNSTMQTRRFSDGFGPNEYFAKASVIYGPYSPAIYLYFNAWRLSKYFAQLEWTTTRELNNHTFEIERRFDQDTGFKKVGSLPSLAPNGNSTFKIDYKHADPNQYGGWSYYRIKATSKNGRISYSEIKAVPPFLEVSIWPNPNRGQFQLRVQGNNGPVMVQITNILGQVLHQYELTASAVVQVTNLSKGAYIVVFYDKATHRLMRTEKVMVVDR